MNGEWFTEVPTERLTYTTPKTKQIPDMSVTPLFWGVVIDQGIDEGHLIAPEIIKGG